MATGMATSATSIGNSASNLWLINRMTGERTRLSAGHYMKPDHIHPSFSADGSRILIQSGSLTQGQRLSLIIVPVDDLTAKK